MKAQLPANTTQWHSPSDEWRVCIADVGWWRDNNI